MNKIRDILKGMFVTVTPNIKLDIDQAEKEIKTHYIAKEKYYELIMAVAKKYKGETRHQTALKYILRAEKGDDSTQDLCVEAI